MAQRPKELSAHTPPKPLATVDLWRKWRACCVKEFADGTVDAQSIDAFKEHLCTAPMFVHFNEGLEQLLLNDRATTPVALTPNAWLALTWVVLRALGNAPKRDVREQRKAIMAALGKANSMYKKSQGQPIGAVSMKDWIDRGPWKHNTPLWTLLFQQGLRMVHPHNEPLFWALREHWLTQVCEGTVPHEEAARMAETTEMAPWGLPRPMSLANVQTVLRSAKRWAVRAGNTLDDAVLLCAPDPQWLGVYMFALWLAHHDNGSESSPREMGLLQEFLVPANLAYWLVLTHDAAHHRNQRRQLLDVFALDKDAQYSAASNMLIGLQMLAAPTEIQLAMSAWTHWQDSGALDHMLLPELN